MTTRAAKKAREREDTAWHEAAHAIVAEYYDFAVDFASCEKGAKPDDPKMLGWVQFKPEVVTDIWDLPVKRVLALLNMTLAGPASEWIRGTAPDDCASGTDFGDFKETLEFLASEHEYVPTDEEYTALLDSVEKFLRAHWDVVGEVAARMNERGRIEGAEIRELVRTRIGYVPEAEQT
jgi:hypothetical protein